MSETETRAVRDLRNIVTREDEARNQRAVDKLLSLNGQKPQQAPSHPDPLVEHALRNSKI